MSEDKLMALVHQAVGDFGSMLTQSARPRRPARLDRHLADAVRPLTSAARYDRDEKVHCHGPVTVRRVAPGDGEAPGS